MKSVHRIIAFGLLILSAFAAGARGQDLDAALRFEHGSSGLDGWGGGPPQTLHFDSTVVHGGNGAARLERDADSPNSFSALTRQLPLDVAGEWIELHGFLRTEGVTDFAGLWMREDGPAGVLQFDNMQGRGLRGTTDWTEYSIRLPLDENARSLFFGVLVGGEGKVWADDLRLLVDGIPYEQAPKREIEPTVIETDSTFDGGSGIAISSISDAQAEHLAVLARVWGFLKYHHPRIAGGELHWDYELFRIMPEILEASDTESRNHILSEWVMNVGVPESCDPCATPPEDVHLLPEIDWIRNAELLGPELSGQLQQIYENRFAGPEQFYISQVQGVGNPRFEHEPPYAEQRPPDAGYRLLALMRLWNMAEYWFPYRDQIDDDWRLVLSEFLPRFVEAESWDAYRLELLAFISRIGDTHANIWSELSVRPPRGDCHLPIHLRFVEGEATVTSVVTEEENGGFSLEVGDVVESIDGRPVEALVEEWTPYYSASNATTRLRDIARYLPRGDCGKTSLVVRRRDASHTISAERVPDADRRPASHDRPGDTFQLLSPDVAYLKLSSVSAEDIDAYLERAQGTHGMIIDIRNYPSEFVVFALGTRLVNEPTEFARFTVGNVSNPGAFSWTQPLVLQPASPGYDGKIVILVDESSLSQAEYTAMAFRASPNAVVVGSTTAAADGNISQIPLPGGISTLFSGIGVFYPDKTPTQRIGIVPDIVATPTIEGIRAGRDEVLETAVRHVLGPEMDEETIRRMAARDRE